MSNMWREDGTLGQFVDLRGMSEEDFFIMLAVMIGKPQMASDANWFEQRVELENFLSALRQSGFKFYRDDTFLDKHAVFLRYRKWYMAQEIKRMNGEQLEMRMMAGRGRTPDPPNGGSHSD